MICSSTRGCRDHRVHVAANVNLFRQGSSPSGAYHGSRNNHYYSVFPNQVQHLLGQGFKRETLDFMVFATQEPGTVPLFRVYNDVRGDHTYFLDQAGVAQPYAWGYKNDGIVGYVYPTAQCGGAEPLRKVYKDTLVVPKIYPGGRAYHNVISNYDHLLITHEPSYFHAVLLPRCSPAGLQVRVGGRLRLPCGYKGGGPAGS
ncbi:hypothetical protein HGRIS_004256 [Hohenbuehelia grisea]|uniref:DUF5648 domain-containing protein n=1 Tax=Hohenbuehelia grisea TaxID=104357 RepID=A0ABR3IP84_9AGAR